MLHRVVSAGLAGALAVTLLAGTTPAYAYWDSTGSGMATASSGTLQAPLNVAAVASGPARAALTWTASTGAPTPQGYYAERIGTNGTQPACASSITALLSTAGCVDSGLAAGTYTYRVTAVYRSWTAASASSSPVIIASSLLGAAAPFSILGSAVTTTGFTEVSGDLGVSPGTTVVGFPDGVVDGTIHAGDSTAAAAQLAFVSASVALAGRTATTQIAGDLAGVTLVPGVYHAGAALALTGTLTFDGGGDPNAIFIIQGDAAVNTAAASSMVLINGAQAANIYWVVNAAVGTGALASFDGNILAVGAITLGAGSLLIGRALSQVAVTMADNDVRFTAAVPPTITISGGSALVTKTTSPTIAGTTTAPAGEVVTVTLGGQTLTTTVRTDQSWSVTAGVLLSGTYPVVAKVHDAAGNGATATQSLTVETNPLPVALGAAATFSVLTGATLTNTGTSTIGGDVGTSPGTTVTGLAAPTTVGGMIHAGDSTASGALIALSSAITDASTRRADSAFTGDTIGQTFHEGVHHTDAAFALTGTLTLDAEGDPSAVFIFQINAAMNTAANTTVLLTNGATASHVFWVVNGAVGTGAGATLPGTILASGAITLGAGTLLTGRALSLGAVVMAGSTIAVPTP